MMSVVVSWFKCACLFLSATGVASTVIIPPYYNFSSLFKTPTVPESGDVPYLAKYDFIQHSTNSCLTQTKLPKHSVNKAIPIVDVAEKIAENNYLTGTTYWLNEYMHVGHITFDIVLMQLLKNTKIDRVIMQRAACNAKQCVGVGTVRSFFGAYFAAIQDAFQPNIPLYWRYAWTEKYVQPYFVSTSTPGYEIEEKDKSEYQKSFKGIHLESEMCFESVIRRGSAYHGNYYGSVAPEVIAQFKAKAYSSKNMPVPLTTYFSALPPYKILVSLRDSGGTRRIANKDLIFTHLNNAFKKPDYEVVYFDNGNPETTSETQIAAVASSNIILTNHGAFEGNIIYMRNGTLLIELSGSYHNPEFRFFQHFAHMFGVYYSRIQTSELVDHQQGMFNITESETMEVVKTMTEYFTLKPFMFNAK